MTGTIMLAEVIALLGSDVKSLAFSPSFRHLELEGNLKYQLIKIHEPHPHPLNHVQV